jgi:hypothetical protein
MTTPKKPRAEGEIGNAKRGIGKCRTESQRQMTGVLSVASGNAKSLVLPTPESEILVPLEAVKKEIEE